MKTGRDHILIWLIGLIPFLVGGGLFAVGVLRSTFVDDNGPIDSMTVYSLDGTFHPMSGAKPPGETFHRYPVLGKVDIESPRDRAAILAAVKRGIAEYKGAENKCFWPRHGVRLSQRGRTIEYLICFECGELDEFVDGVRASNTTKPTTDAAAAILNEHLQSAGVPQQRPN
jgi:hypothetical protein